MKKAQVCDYCQHFDFGECIDDPLPGVVAAWIRKPGCIKGHKVRFYMPRSPMDSDYGWKRRCDDFQVSDSVIPIVVK